MTAAKIGLPVLDADGMGRAFPELQVRNGCNLFTHKLLHLVSSLTPSVHKPLLVILTLCCSIMHIDKLVLLYLSCINLHSSICV